MVSRSNRLRDQLIEISDSEDVHLTIYQSPRFKTYALRAEQQLEQINVVTKELQKENLSLSDSQFAVGALMEAVVHGRSKTENQFKFCKLQFRSTELLGKSSPDRVFESGVLKI